MGAIADFLRKKYDRNCDIAETPQAAAVAAANQEIALNDADRLFIVVVNLSAANTLYITFNPVAAVPAGFVLGAGGGGISFDVNIHGPMSGRRLFASATAYPTAYYLATVRGII